MPDVQLFSNNPMFCTRQLSIDETLTLPKFDVLVESNPDTSSVLAKCGDPNLGALFVKNVVHKLIRCGGTPIDLNFMQEMFPQMGGPTMVDTKRWFNHYFCDPDLNIWAASSAAGTAPGVATWFQIAKSSHGGSGTYSLPVPGYVLMDKDNQVQYTVVDVDTSVPYAHRVQVIPNDETVTVSIKANKAYLILPAVMIGGCSTTLLTNKMSSIGYTQEVHPLRLRNDWKICVDVLRGYKDKIQFAVIYDTQGKPMDSWDVYEAQQGREGLRMALNVLSFIGTPTTNSQLINGFNNGENTIGIDGNHTGFYGLVPTLKYGGGHVYDYRSDLGFDLEADGEPIFLYQDSRKRTKKFMVLHGAKFGFNLVDRTNKMVSRTQVGANMWEAYKRLGGLTGEDFMTEVAKLGIKSYDYMGFHLDFKKWDSLSDYRFIGSDYFNGMALMIAQDGTSENGKPLQPVEFYNYGSGKYTGAYEEHYIDYRKAPGGEDSIGGWMAESLAMSVHCPDQHILINPIKAA